MEIFAVRDLSFTYPGSDKKTLDSISFSVNRGEFVTVCGFSGNGKSTLLRQLKPMISPHGIKSGSIIYCGKDINDLSDRKQAEKIGFVMQTPDNQTVTDKVWHELVFVAESLGYNNDDIKRRSAETASFFGIEKWYHKRISELSGGQRQILNIASVMMTSPEVLILDEPTSQLDPIAAEKLLQLIKKINKELGTTIIISSHDLDRLFSLSDRMIVLYDGKIISDAPPKDTAENLSRISSPLFEAVPLCTRLYYHLEKKDGKPPFDITEGREMISDEKKKHLIKQVNIIGKTHKDTPAVSLNEVCFRYERNSDDILCGAGFKAYKGEILSLMGGNGSGKTTLIKTAAGIVKAYSGKIKIYDKNKIAYMPQDPRTLFVCESVREELYEVCEDEDKIKSAVISCGLEELLDMNPYDLSGGQQQRAALAKLLLTEPDIMLMDEPVKGMDISAKNETGRMIRSLADSGKCIVIASHDMDFCARFSDRCAMLFDGQVIGADEVHSFFCSNHFYTTNARRLTEGIIDNCVNQEDIYSAFGIENKNKTLPPAASGKDFDIERKKTNEIKITPVKSEKRLLLSSVFILFFTVPLTIFAGIFFLNDTKYLFISLLIMLECMIPVFIGFEKKKSDKNKSREIVLLSVMTALCVLSRTAFYMFPEFKPVTAMVILSGAALGAESGFMIGSMTMLCSNIIFGQGPWTPWQMFVMGLIGFLAGIIFGSGRLPVKKSNLIIFGVICTIIIYGIIMDPAAAVISHIELTPQIFIAYCLAGLPMNIIHAVSTAFFLFIGAYPVLKKIERIKLKYGIIT